MHIFYEESFQKQCFRYASQKIVDFHFAISNTLQRCTLFENHCGSLILQHCDAIFKFKWDIFDDLLNTVRYVSNYSWVSKSVISTTELLRMVLVDSTLTFFNAFCVDKMCSEETMNNLPQTVKKEALFSIADTAVASWIITTARMHAKCLNTLSFEVLTFWRENSNVFID